jgi:hypothetical protein
MHEPLRNIMFLLVSREVSAPYALRRSAIPFQFRREKARREFSKQSALVGVFRYSGISVAHV